MTSKGLFERFARETSSGRFIPQLDGLRFVAIAMVVLFHVNAYVAADSPVAFAIRPENDLLSRLLAHGHYGVQFFFIISGFILALPFASHHLLQTSKTNLRRYFTRRLTRLEPPYLFNLILLCTLIAMWQGQALRTLLPHLAAGIVYQHDLFYGRANYLNSVAWSLEIEVQFYLLVPLLTRLFAVPGRLRRRAAIIGLGLAAIIFQRLFVPGADGRIALSLLNFLQFFLIGFLLADLYLCEWREDTTQHWAWDVIAVAGWSLLPVIWAHSLTISFLFPVVAFLLYCAAFRGPLSYRILGNRWLVTIGGMCYTIYLVHYQIINFVFARSKSLALTNMFEINLLAQFLIIGPIVLGSSAVLFLLIEKPCMKRDWPQRLWQKLSVRLRPQTQPQPAKAGD
jgi:peptidoglycan/LPS O-acetylase OafA/YrhL